MTAGGILVTEYEARSAHVDPGDVAALWASAVITDLNVTDAPEYGSPAWLALRADDPRRAAAIITAAEQWRRYAAHEAWLDRLLDEDPEHWFRIVTADANAYARSIAAELARRPTHDEIAARREAVHAPREAKASPGWPPIAIPGRPGWWRHCGPNGEQVDLPHSAPRGQEMAA